MAFQSVPETVEINIQGTQNSVIMTNTYHARLVGGYSQLDLDTLADDIDLIVNSDWIPIWPSSLTYNHVEVRGLESSVDLIATSANSAGAGGVAVVPMPNNVTYAIRKLSGFTGRSARGRVFIYGIPGSYKDTDENFITGAAGLDYVDAVDAVRVEIDAQGWVPVIVSRWTGGSKRAEGVTFEWLTTSAFDNRFDTMRGRLPST